jgi:hypothetical protein
MVSLVGCAQAPKPLYFWGSYQAQVYDHFRSDGKGPLEQLRLLDEQAQKAKAASLPLPPGFHAHLGLVYLKLGRDDDARRELETERVQFPEGSAYIRSLLEKMNGGKS